MANYIDELQSILNEEGFFDRLSKNVSKAKDNLKKNIEDTPKNISKNISKAKDNLKKNIEDAPKNLAKAGDNLKKNIEDTPTRLAKNIRNAGDNLKKNIEDTPTRLAKNIRKATGNETHMDRIKQFADNHGGKAAMVAGGLAAGAGALALRNRLKNNKNK